MPPNDDPNLLSGLIHFAMLAACGVALLHLTRAHRETVRFQVRLFLVAFVARFLCSVAIYQGGLVDVIKDEDASGWAVGLAYQETWMKEGKSLLDLPELFAQAYRFQNRGFYHLLGCYFFATFLPSRLAAAAFNGFAGSLTAVVIYRISRSLFGESTARKAGWLTCFYPAVIIWSAQTVKEPVVILLESVALYGAVCLRQRGLSGRHTVLTVAAVVLLIPFRFYAAFIGMVTAAVALTLPRLQQSRRAGARPGIWLAALPCLALAYWMLQKDVQAERYNIEYIENVRNYAARTQGSGVEVGFSLDNPFGMAASTVIGAVHLLFAPFPWQLAGGSLRMFLVGPEVLLWYWLFLAAIAPGMRYVFQRRLDDLLPVFLFLIPLAFLYCLLFSNVGLVYRQRAQLMPWLLVFAAVGLELRGAARRRAKATAETPAWRQNPAPRTAPSGAGSQSG
jgi:hypothetical protein